MHEERGSLQLLQWGQKVTAAKLKDAVSDDESSNEAAAGSQERM